MKNVHFELPEIYGEPLSYYEFLRKVTKRLHTEELTREEDDKKLQTNIDNESKARNEADNTLQTNIDNEATARTNADNALQEKINTNKNDISELKGDLSNKLQKSPVDWEQWTAEEQAVARERIGLRNLELISELTVAEDVEMFSMGGLDLNRILIDIELSDLPSSGITAQIYIQTPVNNLVYIGRIAQASRNRRIIINAEYVKSFIVVSSIFSNTYNNANSNVTSSPPIYCDNCDNIKGFMLTFALYAGSKIKVFGGI